MIGGDDIVIEGPSGIDDVMTILSFMRHAWPDAVFEATMQEGDEPARLERPFPARLMAEIFIYRDLSSYTSWKCDGLTNDNGSAIVYIVIEPEAISFVVDDRSSEAGLLIQELVFAVDRNRRARPDPPVVKEAA